MSMREVRGETAEAAFLAAEHGAVPTDATGSKRAKSRRPFSNGLLGAVAPPQKVALYSHALPVGEPVK